MIYAKDLRIGNYVQGPSLSISRLNIYGDGVVQITSLLNEDLPLQPIPLTEEWLLKLGYKYVYETSAYHDKIHMITVGSFGFVFMPFCTNDEDCYVPISNVHQLQNICYALTGIELTITEPDA